MLKAPMMTWLLAMLLVVMATMIAELFDQQRNTDERPRAMHLGATTTEWFEEQPNADATKSSLDPRLATLVAAAWTVRRDQRLSCARGGEASHHRGLGGWRGAPAAPRARGRRPAGGVSPEAASRARRRTARGPPAVAVAGENERGREDND